MSWNYRVVKRKYEEDIIYGIYEAYYGKVEKKPHSITDEPMSPMGDTLKELQKDLTMMLDALNKPTLKYEDF